MQNEEIKKEEHITKKVELKPSYDNWRNLIDSIIAKNKTEQKKYNIDGTNSFGSDFTIRAIDTTNSVYVRGSRAIYPILFLCNRYYEWYRHNKGIAYTINDENKKFLNNLFENTFSKQVISGKYLYEEGAYFVDKDEQDIMFFLPTGLKKPCAMKPNDSFIIDGKIGKILWCHIYNEAEGLENEFMGIPVVIQENGTTGQLHFNIDGSPQVLKLSEKQSDQNKQILCGIKMSPNLQPNSTTYRDDIVLYSQYEFDFYAQEGQKCCNEEIDNTTPIKYQGLEPGHIQLTFINKDGKQITAHVNEKGENLKEIMEKRKQNAISELKDKIKIEFEDKENNPSFDFDKILTSVSGTINNSKIDGLSIDKNKKAQFIMGKKGDITQIYRLDKQNFPLQHDNNHEILYTKQPNDKNYVNYYDKNGKQQILQFNESNLNPISSKTGLYICIDNKIFKKTKNGKFEDSSDMTKDMFGKLQDNDFLIHNAGDCQTDEKGIFRIYKNKKLYYRPKINKTSDLVWQQSTER